MSKGRGDPARISPAILRRYLWPEYQVVLFYPFLGFLYIICPYLCAWSSDRAFLDLLYNDFFSVNVMASFLETCCWMIEGMGDLNRQKQI